MNLNIHNYIIEVYRVVENAYEYSYVESFSLDNSGVQIATTNKAMNAFGCKRIQTAEMIADAINNSPCEYSALIMSALSCVAAENEITQEQALEIARKQKS